jgi:hypothetical protein
MMSVRTIRIGALAAVVVLTAAVGWAGLALADTDPSTTTVRLASSDDGPGDISGPCDEPENAGRARCAGVAVPAQVTSTSTTLPATSTIVSPPTTQATTSTTSTTPTTSPAPRAAPGTGATRSFDAAGAGTVAYTVDGGTLTLVAATPAAGWVVEVEQASGRELELDFRSGDQRVQVNVEFEDGGVRERVRFRDDSDDRRVEVTNGQLTDVRGADDNSGSGSSDGGDNSGSGSSGGNDGGDRDDHGGGDDSGSGSSGGDDDGGGDDNSGSGGGDDHGHDDD